MNQLIEQIIVWIIKITAAVQNFFIIFTVKFPNHIMEQISVLLFQVFQAL